MAFDLKALPAHILLDLARNPSASFEWRKAATRLLLKNEAKQAQHEDLVWLVREIEKDEQAEKEVISVVESAIEGEWGGEA